MIIIIESQRVPAYAEIISLYQMTIQRAINHSINRCRTIVIISKFMNSCEEFSVH
jgi:hypothetical protein